MRYWPSVFGTYGTAVKHENTHTEAPLGFVPQADVAEHKDKYVLTLATPGLKKSDLNIALDGNRLTISGERKAQTENNDGGYQYFESRYGSFSRSFVLPRHAHKEAIEARYEDGVLVISIPKVEAEAAQTIEIK